MATVNPTQAQLQQMITAAAKQYGVDPSLALAVAKTESNFNPSATNSNSNGTTDYGVMQINSSNLPSLGISDPLDPQQNINAGVSMLASLLNQYGGNVQQALWAYNAGPGSVASGSIPGSTASYVQTVLSNQSQFSTTVPAVLVSNDTGTVSDGSVTDFFSADVTLFGSSVPMGYAMAGGVLLLGLLAAFLLRD